MKEKIELIDLYDRMYNIINNGVYEHNSDAEVSRKAVLKSIQLKIRTLRKDLLYLAGEEMEIEIPHFKQEPTP